MKSQNMGCGFGDEIWRNADAGGDSTVAVLLMRHDAEVGIGGCGDCNVGLP